MYLHALSWISSHFTSDLANNNSTLHQNTCALMRKSLIFQFYIGTYIVYKVQSGIHFLKTKGHSKVVMDFTKILFYKVHTFWEGHTNFSCKTSKLRRRLRQIFVPFSENLNFIDNSVCLLKSPELDSHPKSESAVFQLQQ